VAVTKISEFMSKIGAQGGMSLTTGFDVQFDFALGKDKQPKPFENYYTSDNKSIVNMLCDEAQLPNVQSAVASVTGRYLGEGAVYYPHTRLFTDLSLSFLMDADMIPLKFFTSWYDYIFGEGDQKTFNGTLTGALSAAPRQRNRFNRLKHLNKYVSTTRIIKTEPSSAASNERAPILYILEDCYPYSIDAVPLSYGTSQVARLSVNFYYSRHTIYYGDTRKVR